MKTLEDLSAKQRKFIMENALELFDATVLSGDSINDILESTCKCCAMRRAFVKKLLKETV